MDKVQLLGATILYNGSEAKNEKYHGEVTTPQELEIHRRLARLKYWKKYPKGIRVEFITRRNHLLYPEHFWH